MKVDEIMLRAYVDGELHPELRDRIEVVLANSAELREQANALRASVLPYRMAFDRQPLPPVPKALQKQVETLAALAKAPQREPARVVPLMSRRRWIGTGLAMAASFAAGVIVPTALLRGGDAGMNVAGSDWVRSIAVYQSLYSRETVEPLADDAVRTRQVLANFTAKEGLPVEVPDLRSEGMVFKRVQPLVVGEAPLMQMVFQTPQGKPAALCVLARRNQPDTKVALQRIEGLEVATWRRGGLAYVLVVDMPKAQAAVLADRLANDEFPTLHRSTARG